MAKSREVSHGGAVGAMSEVACRTTGHEAEDRFANTGTATCLRCGQSFDVAADHRRMDRLWWPALTVFFACQAVATAWWFLTR